MWSESRILIHDLLACKTLQNSISGVLGSWLSMGTYASATVINLKQAYQQRLEPTDSLLFEGWEPRQLGRNSSSNIFCGDRHNTSSYKYEAANDAAECTYTASKYPTEFRHAHIARWTLDGLGDQQG